MSLEMPLVCVCIPCFNNEKTILHTLNSISHQTYGNFIVKIFDNASTDSSVELIQSWIKNQKSKFSLKINKENVGAESNFNRCFDEAEGKYVAVFHADDVYDPQILQKQVSFLELNEDCSAVSTLARRIDAQGLELEKPAYPDFFLNKNIDKYDYLSLLKITLGYGNLITCPSVMSRTEVIKNKIKTWDFEKYSTSSDLDVWLRLAREGQFGIIKENLIDYRVSEASYSYRTRNDVRINDLYLVLDHHLSQNKESLHEDVLWGYTFKYNQGVFVANIRKRLLKQQDYFPYRKLRLKFKFIYFKYLVKKLVIPGLLKVKVGRDFFVRRGGLKF